MHKTVSAVGATSPVSRRILLPIAILEKRRPRVSGFSFSVPFLFSVVKFPLPLTPIIPALAVHSLVSPIIPALTRPPGVGVEKTRSFSLRMRNSNFPFSANFNVYHYIICHCIYADIPISGKPAPTTSARDYGVVLVAERRTK